MRLSDCGNQSTSHSLLLRRIARSANVDPSFFVERAGSFWKKDSASLYPIRLDQVTQFGSRFEPGKVSIVAIVPEKDDRRVRYFVAIHTDSLVKD